MSGLPTTLAANGPAPAAAATLYVGDVMHARLKPVGHRFAYRVFCVLLDLDRLDEAARASPLFSVDRPNLVSFRRRDHGPRDGSDLRLHVDALLAGTGLAAPPARILILAYPRVMGTLFNPLSVYWAYDAAGALTGVVYEVRNTFGEMHAYAKRVMPGELGDEGLRQEQAKRFHVSPFVDMAQRYRFRLLPPGAGVRIRILEVDSAGPTLAASFAGRAEPFTTARLVAAAARFPLLGVKILAAIHFEAFRLWWKGLSVQPRPVAVAGDMGDAAGSTAPTERPRPR